MKEKKIDAVDVWKEFDALAVRIGLTVIDRAAYLYLLRLTHVEGKRRLRFSILGIAPHLGLSGGPVREAVRRLLDKGALRLIERSNIGHLVEVRLPKEVRAPRVRRTGAGGTFARLRASAGKLPDGTNLEEVDFLRTGALRQAIHVREGGVCFYCLRRTPALAHCLDHMVPLVEGGINSYRNLVSCCMGCNSDKRGHSAEDFLRRLYREGSLSKKDFDERLRALQVLKSAKRRPHVLSEEHEGSRPGKRSRAALKTLAPLRNVLRT